MKDSKDYNDKFIGKIRLFLSISFALIIYLPVYILTILPTPTEGIFSFFRDIILFIIFLIIGYYFLYNRLWLRRFIYKRVPFYWILLFYLLTASLIGALLWWVFTADIYISFLFRDVGILFIAFLIALIVGYYFLYNPLWLRRFIYKEISFYWILLFYLFVTSLTGTLLWWIPTADAYISFGVGPLCAFLGAVLGFILGLMGSMVIVIFKIKNSKDYNDKFIGKIRLFLSVSFALFIYSPVYFFIVFSVENISSLVRNVGIVFILFITFLIIGYFFLYNRLWLKRFIYKEISFYWILLKLLKTFTISILAWRILEIIEGTPEKIWGFDTSCGAMLGFIFGLMSSIVIVILRKKFLQQDR